MELGKFGEAKTKARKPPVRFTENFLQSHTAFLWYLIVSTSPFLLVVVADFEVNIIFILQYCWE